MLVMAFGAPILGLLSVLVANHVMIANSKQLLANNGEDVGTHSSKWVPPLAAIFLGCIAKLCFDYISGIIKDSIDVLFLCFAIDEDNGITRLRGENDFDTMVKQMPQFIVAIPVQELDPDSPVVTGVVVDESSPEEELIFPTILKHGKEVDIEMDNTEWIVAVTRKDEDWNRRQYQ